VRCQELSEKLLPRRPLEFLGAYIGNGRVYGRASLSRSILPVATLQRLAGRHQIDGTHRRLRVEAPPSAIACARASHSDSMSSKPVQTPLEILSYAIKISVPLMTARVRMDSSQQVPIGGPPLIGRESGKTLEDGRKVGV